MKIEVKKLSNNEIKDMNIKSWNIWEKEISRFPWTYHEEELCYILEGEVIVETKLETVRIVAGDFVRFPANLECVWDIKKKIKKHYKFS